MHGATGTACTTGSSNAGVAASTSAGARSAVAGPALRPPVRRATPDLEAVCVGGDIAGRWDGCAGPIAAAGGSLAARSAAPPVVLPPAFAAGAALDAFAAGVVAPAALVAPVAFAAGAALDALAGAVAATLTAVDGAEAEAGAAIGTA
jgi:hypothetical protein